MDAWLIAAAAYLLAALLTFIPTGQALLRKVGRKDVEDSLAQAKATIEKAHPIDGLDDAAKQALVLNFERLAGTLVFWKFEAAKYRATHLYCLIWTIPSAVLIPIVTQAAAGTKGGTTLVTVISAFTAILLAFHKGFKVEEHYRAQGARTSRRRNRRVQDDSAQS
jgi:hypothetical protein